MSIAVAIAEAVKDQLADGVFSQAFTPERHYVVFRELKDFGSLKVDVGPAKLTLTNDGTRGMPVRNYGINIWIGKKLATFDLSEIDPLMSLVEELIDFLEKNNRPPTFKDAVFVDFENELIFDPEHLSQNQQFFSVIECTYRAGVE